MGAIRRARSDVPPPSELNSESAVSPPLPTITQIKSNQSCPTKDHMDRHRDVVIKAHELRQDVRQVAAKMKPTRAKLNLLQCLEVRLISPLLFMSMI